MLLGSRNGLPVLVEEPETPVPVVPLVAAPDCDAVADLSSTGAALSSVGVVLQPASAIAISVANRTLRIQPPTLVGPETRLELGATGGNVDRNSRLEPMSLPRERPPSGLTYVGGRRDEPLLYASVAGDRGQYTTASAFVRVDNQFAVRCDARAQIIGPVGQYLHLARRVVHQCNLVTVPGAAHEHEALAVGRGPRRHVVVAVEGQPLDVAAADAGAIDLRRAAAIGGEDERPAVGRECSLGIDARRRHDAGGWSAVSVDHVDLRAAVFRERHEQPARIRRPGGRAVAAAKVG